MNAKIAILKPALALTVLALLCAGHSEAQTKTSGKSGTTATSGTATTAKTSTPATTTGTATTGKTPVAEAALKFHNMDEWRKSPAYAKRKSTYDKSTPTVQSRKFSFQDKSTLTIGLDKKNPNINMGGVVEKKLSTGKKESSGGYDCTTSTINLTANSTSFLNNDYSGSTANIFPGACYTYANLTNGSWQQQFGDRYTVQVSTDNPQINGTSYINVSNPDQATLQNAVSELFRRMPNITGNESFAYQVSLADNSAAYNLNIGASASGYGADLSNVYSNGNQSSHVHLTVDATKTLFSMTTTPPDSGFFKDPKVEATPYLSFISEVDYGVRVLANADLTFSSQQEADQFKASYSGFGVSAALNVGYGSVSKNVQCTINCYVIGGPGGTTVAYSLAELEKQIQKIFATCTYRQARPIKYVASAMTGDDLNTYSATDNFEVRSCVPANGGSPEIDNIVLTLMQGGDGKEPKTGFRMDVDAGMNAGASADPMFTVYTCGTENQGFANNSTTTIILKRNPQYKGKFDLETLQKSGGHIHIWPICYTPYSSSGIGTDLWDIVNINMAINLKPSADNPNPQPIGGTASNQLNWSLQGANMLVLNSSQQNQVDFFFNSNLQAGGTSN
jgi:hypothetical protein